MRWRSGLFVPADREDMAAKVARTGADYAVLDLEDGVALTRKADARAAMARTVAPLAEQIPVIVRVNGVHTEHFAADVRALPQGIAAVMVPKVDSRDDVEKVAGALDAVGHDGMAIVAGFETVMGVEHCGEALGERVIACYFGAEDYIADLGGVRTASSTEVLFPRSRVAIAARLAGSAALDQIVTDYRNDERLRVDAALGRSLGYSGKMCIHPAQVPLVNAAFSPTEAEIERAQRLIAAYEQALAHGRGAVAFEGQMIDEPLVRQAWAVLARADERADGNETPQ